MKLTEDELCSAFAEAAKNSETFTRWILLRTKFAGYASAVRLLHEEQLSIRPRKFWWRHWWCHIPELAKDRETDIFMVFEIAGGEQRFALHIENKMDNGRFAPGQAEAYRPRAAHMANKPEYLGYQDHQTILLAPVSFMWKHPGSCTHFDACLSYEDVASFVPQFRALQARRSEGTGLSSACS
ncbi:MAG: hypothetical protein J0H99_01085 [Rhodospirillales bacterium]|nr:hypothetical protein [Rhodospirillales bacterium]